MNICFICKRPFNAKLLKYILPRLSHPQWFPCVLCPLSDEIQFIAKFIQDICPQEVIHCGDVAVDVILVPTDGVKDAGRGAQYLQNVIHRDEYCTMFINNHIEKSSGAYTYVHYI